jgi:hypothetical protein
MYLQEHFFFTENPRWPIALHGLLRLQHSRLEICSAVEVQRRKAMVHQLTNILHHLEGEICMVEVTYFSFLYFVSFCSFLWAFSLQLCDPC